MRVIVIGSGVFGASLAWALQRQGEEVVLVDQYGAGDPRATSGGETRLIRCSHGDDTDYSAMAWRALELWPQVGGGLLERTGVSWFAYRDDGWETASERTLQTLGIPIERADHPHARGDDLAFTLFEPQAGVLRARDGVLALTRELDVVRARATPHGAAAQLDDGSVLEGDHVVWACGGWLAGLFPDLVTLRVTRQDLFFFACDWAGPAWVDYDRAMYGTGNLGEGAKVAPDAEGPPCDPDADLPPCDPANELVARDYLARRFPSLAAAPLLTSRSCRYELSPDSHFLAGPHPEHAGVWLFGGGSGHGFKHGPALGERMAAALAGGPLPQTWSVGARSPGQSLRTAGS